MSDNLGQKSTVWDDWWGGITPLSEIRMWDYYGGRQWISKYTPRYGKSIEAGCGVGRYVFLFKRFGIDIEGVDFSDTVIERLEQVKIEIEPSAVFIKGDVTKLPYSDNILSGYLSFGVVEHFIDGPQKPIQEAFRVLRPGGIAIISTPNISFLIAYRNAMRKMKDMVKKIIGKKIIQPPFFQYEYSAKTLKKYMIDAGFHVSKAESFDLLYSFYELGGFKKSAINKGSIGYFLSNLLENSPLKRFGGQSITISVKVAPQMYCFLSGEFDATPDSLELFDVPISKKMQNSELAKFFLKNSSPKFDCKYEIEPKLKIGKTAVCSETGKEYVFDPIFENFGFNSPISPEILKSPQINIKHSIINLKPVWRNRNV